MHWIVLGVVLIGLAIYLLIPVKDETDKKTPLLESHSSDTKKLPDLSGSRLRSLTASELIERLNLEPVIDNIKIHSGLSLENWNKDALPFIHNFLALVQRLPASESHHHAGDGGLARHTLDVAAMALKQSAGRSFPPGAKTEDIPKLTAVWKYGILVAALLHDVGKVLTGFNITLSDIDNKNQQLWLPDAGNMPPDRYYYVDFLSENHRYSAHAEIAWSFFMTLVPESTRQWIAHSAPDLLVLLRSYLSGKKDGSVIEELVKSADMASVSRDLASGNRQRFATAKRTPLIEIIMNTLQEMLADRGRYFTIARDAGGDLFRKGDTIYMISKNVPDYIREYLKESKHPESKSIPTDNSRIFDTLLEYKAIIPNPFDESKAITNIAVSFVKADKTSVETQFTVLAFNAKTLYPDGDYPAEFAGNLEVVEHITKTPKTEPVKVEKTSEPVIPPIMAKPDNPSEPAEEEPNTSLEALLGIKTQTEPAEETSEENHEPAENTQPENTDTAFSSIDDLLKLTGLLEEQDDEPIQETVSACPNSTPEQDNRQAETVHKESPKSKKQNKQNKQNQLKALFESVEATEKTEPIQEKISGSLNLNDGYDESDDIDEDINNGQTETENIPTALPRPVPIKDAPNLDNLSEIKQDLRIRKALANDVPDNTDAFRYQGMKFLHWLANGLSDGSISYNTPQSFVHFVEEGMILVTPASFRAYAGEFNNRNPKCKGVEAQKSFQFLGITAKNDRRSNFYRAFNKSDEPLFLCYLIPDSKLHHLIQMSTRPNNNPDLYVISVSSISRVSL